VNSDFNLTSLCDISVDVYFTNPNSTLQNHLSTDTYTPVKHWCLVMVLFTM